MTLPQGQAEQSDERNVINEIKGIQAMYAPYKTIEVVNNVQEEKFLSSKSATTTAAGGGGLNFQIAPLGGATNQAEENGLCQFSTWMYTEKDPTKKNEEILALHAMADHEMPYDNPDPKKLEPKKIIGNRN